MKNARKVATAGMLTALCFVSLYLGSIFQTLDLSAAAIGSIIVLIAMIELDKKWALGVYIAASVLSVLLLPYKSPAVVFALFAGFYPILKAPLNKIKPIVFSYFARIVCFNLAFFALFYVLTKLLNIQEDYLSLEIVIFALGNVAFLVYDFALERIAATYLTRLKPMIFGKR